MKLAIFSILLFFALSCSKSSAPAPISMTLKATSHLDSLSLWITFAVTPDKVVSIDNVHLSAQYHFDWYFKDSLLYQFGNAQGLFSSVDSFAVSIPGGRLPAYPNYNPSMLNVRNFKIDTVYIVANPTGSKINLTY